VVVVSSTHSMPRLVRRPLLFPRHSRHVIPRRRCVHLSPPIICSTCGTRTTRVTGTHVVSAYASRRITPSLRPAMAKGKTVDGFSTGVSFASPIFTTRSRTAVHPKASLCSLKVKIVCTRMPAAIDRSVLHLMSSTNPLGVVSQEPSWPSFLLTA
jgi:hypothetical protein